MLISKEKWRQLDEQAAKDKEKEGRDVQDSCVLLGPSLGGCEDCQGCCGIVTVERERERERCRDCQDAASNHVHVSGAVKESR